MSDRPLPEGTFEEALERLEGSVERLESGNLNLADALDVFEAGINASRACTRLLDQTRKRVQVLLADDAGDLHLSFLEDESFESSELEEAEPADDEEDG